MKSLSKVPYLMEPINQNLYKQTLPHIQRMKRISKLSDRIGTYHIKQVNERKQKNQAHIEHRSDNTKKKRYETDVSTVCIFSEQRGDSQIQNVLNNANTYKFNNKYSRLTTNTQKNGISYGFFSQTVKKNPISKQNKIGKILKIKITNISQLIINMLWIDLQLSKTINLFPMQLQQLQQQLPHKNLRPILKLINTIIDSSKKQIKNDDNSWKQIAIYLLQLSYKQWQVRWQLKQYQNLIKLKDKMGMNNIIRIVLDELEVDQKLVMTRGLIMRYLMDIDE